MSDKAKSEEIEMVFYLLKLQSCYLQSGSIKGDFKACQAAAIEIQELIKKLQLHSS